MTNIFLSLTNGKVVRQKLPLITQDGRHEKVFFLDISTSDRGDFPRIIEIALSITAKKIIFLGIT